MKQIQFTREFFENMKELTPYRFDNKQFGIYKNDNSITIVSYNKVVGYINTKDNYIDIVRIKGYSTTNKQITQFLNKVRDIFNMFTITINRDIWTHYFINSQFDFTI